MLEQYAKFKNPENKLFSGLKPSTGLAEYWKVGECTRKPDTRIAIKACLARNRSNTMHLLL